MENSWCDRVHSVVFDKWSKFILWDIKSPVYQLKCLLFKSINPGGFSDGSMVKNLPTNAGYLGLIPDLGKSHMPQNN